MAEIVSKQKDLAQGCVFLTVKDANGTLSSHTIYVLGLNGRTITEAIADILADVDALTDKLNAAFAAAGM